MALVERKMSLRMYRRVEENTVNWAKFLTASASSVMSSCASGTEGKCSTVSRDKCTHAGKGEDLTSLLNFLRYGTRAAHDVNCD